jgi:addiction module HigA family antidote
MSVRKVKKKLAPIHPGEVLREDFIKPLDLSVNRVALDLRVPATRIAEIVRGARAITADTALRLARYFKTSPQFWMNLQRDYELQMVEDAKSADISRDVQPLAVRMAKRAVG